MTQRQSDKFDLLAWRRRQPKEQRGEAYRRWRATVPWTDEQLAVAMEHHANTFTENAFMRSRWLARASAVRAGCLHGTWLSTVLNYLVKTCQVCGKKALYRSFDMGLCSQHRHVKRKADAERIRLRESQASEIERSIAERDTYDLGIASARTSGKFNKDTFKR